MIELQIEEYNDVFWYRNNGRHNNYGPAFKLSDGTKIWFVNAVAHRLDGPAYEALNGTKEWYINDIEHTYLEYLVALEQINSSKENI